MGMGKYTGMLWEEIREHGMTMETIYFTMSLCVIDFYSIGCGP